MAELGLDSIMGEDDIENLFADPDEEVTSGQEDAEEKDEKEEKETAEAVNPETLFEEEQSESVGGGKDRKTREKEEPTSDEDTGASPNNFYSSIASALAEEGVFPDLDDEAVGKIESAEDFRQLVENQINAGITEREKRIYDALQGGVEPTEVRKYENTLNYLDGVTEKQLAEESEKGEQLRRSIIYQDYINRGYTQEKALKYTNRAVDAGTDVEDAKDALQSNKEYFQGEYDRLLRAGEESQRKAEAARKARAAKMRDTMLKEKNPLGGIEVDKGLRQKAFDCISKPVYRDPDTGNYYTAIQKYEMEHSDDFMKYVGLLFTMTDGFTNFDGFTKGKVRREVKKGLRELEHTLSNTRTDAGGRLQLVTNATDDPESFIGKGIKLDL